MTEATFPNFQCALAMDRTERIYRGLFNEKVAERLPETQAKLLLMELQLGLQQLTEAVRTLAYENAGYVLLYGKVGDGAEQRKHLRGRSVLEGAMDSCSGIMRGGSPEFLFDRMKPYRQDDFTSTDTKTYRQDVVERGAGNAETDGGVRVFELMHHARAAGAAAGD